MERTTSNDSAQRHHYRHKLDRSERPLRILTYNVFMRPLVGANTDKKNERIEHIKEAMMKFDIVCFQELFPQFNNRREDLLAFANECHFKYASVPPSPGFFQMLFKASLINSGLLTISKHEILVTDFIEFTAKAGVDAVATKGVLYSQIKAPNGGFIHVFNTHLQATYNSEYQPDNKGDHNNFMARLQQIEEVRKAVDGFMAQHS